MCGCEGYKVNGVTGGDEVDDVWRCINNNMMCSNL